MKGTLDVDGRVRCYRLFVPSTPAGDAPLPLVVGLHGGGGNGRRFETFTKFTRLASAREFLVAYPDAVQGHWNDGRESQSIPSHREGVDDVHFISALIDEIARDHAVDTRRIYVTGASNGAMMTHRVGMELADRVAAIAPVIGGIPARLAESFHPVRPVSVLIIQGTEDPLVPYSGGTVQPANERRGDVLATHTAVGMWVERDGCQTPGEKEEIPDKDPHDGCTTVRTTYGGGEDYTEVVFYKIHGGGHTWPGGYQYLPESVVGKVCRDFDATATIWDFFSRHHR